MAENEKSNETQKQSFFGKHEAYIKSWARAVYQSYTPTFMWKDEWVKEWEEKRLSDLSPQKRKLYRDLHDFGPLTTTIKAKMGKYDEKESDDTNSATDKKPTAAQSKPNTKDTVRDLNEAQNSETSTNGAENVKLTATLETNSGGKVLANTLPPTPERMPNSNDRMA